MLQKMMPVILFGSIHLLFLFGVIFHVSYIFFGLGFIPLLAYFFFNYVPVKFTLKKYLLTLLSFGFGYILTSEIVDFFSVTPVYASALVGMVFSFFRFKSFPLFSAVVYSGSFAGMVADFHVEELYVAFLVNIIGGSLFYFLKDNFHGIGGKLGSIGFGAMLLPIILDREESLLNKTFDKYLSFNPLGDLSSNKMLLFTLIVSLFGAVITYWLNNKKGFGPVKSSAISSFIIAVPFQILPISGFTALIPLAFFGASFIGMTNQKTLGWFSIISASILYGLAFHFIHPYFNGYGGALGTTACLSCLLVMLFQKTFNRQPIRV